MLQEGRDRSSTFWTTTCMRVPLATCLSRPPSKGWMSELSGTKKGGDYGTCDSLSNVYVQCKDDEKTKLNFLIFM